MHRNLLTAAIALSLAAPAVHAATATRLNPTSVEVKFGGETPQMLLDFYSPDIFRLFIDPQGGIVRDPEATPPAEILVKNPRRPVGSVIVANNSDGSATVTTSRIRVDIAPDAPAITVTDLATGKTVMRQLQAPAFQAKKTDVILTQAPDEYFFGGGIQNGRFSHKGKSIDIVNTNSWTDGGVCSPAPFYWSTGGYGLLWHTFAPGVYDFGTSDPSTVTVSHNTPWLDLFVMVDETPAELLSDYYQLTGNPVLLPKFGFYEGHLNAYNRDYWKEDPNGILYEDGKRYRESQKDNGGVRETLNGEVPANYQFSARAVIDRYNAADMPLGWVLPNDGYGAGYGQTGSLDGNIDNLRQFGDYARQRGVEIGLWTQSDLHPKEGIEPLLQRDIVKEVRDAGVRVLKTDVAWVGAGYSFGLNGVADVGSIMPYYGNDARPFIISLDGWAGTQRYAGIWSGDQTGGEWEYIRFHIPTYICSGLTGQPNISSDMDGIFGGKNLPVNIRDYQWKTFTPMQLNMDGWGANPKYPQALGKQAADINRAYLKLKSQLLPYTYTYAREAVNGKPYVRAMFLDYPNPYTRGTKTRYQFLYGPSLLVAPIYQATAADTLGNDVRHNIYLPQGLWYEYFGNKAYASDGSRIVNNYAAPLWKLPVFVKAGAIIPMYNPSNNPSQIDKALRIYEFWPEGKSEFTEYDDDGTTQAYLAGEYATTRITSSVASSGQLDITIEPTAGRYEGYTPVKATELRINATNEPKNVMASLGKSKTKLHRFNSYEELVSGGGTGWCYTAQSSRLKQFGVADEQPGLPQIIVLLPEVNTTDTPIAVTVKGFGLDALSVEDLVAILEAPAAALEEEDVMPYAVNLRWKPVEGAKSMDILFDGMTYTDIDPAGTFLIEDLQPKTAYDFKLRAHGGPWADLTVTTADNPLEFAISGITATCTVPAQGGARLGRLFDHDDREIWHTKYGETATPFDIVVDLGVFATLDRLEYLPRLDSGNGTILSGTVQLSDNGNDWSEPTAFEWPRSSDVKTIPLNGAQGIRFIKMHVDKAVGNFGSGREIFVFKVPGTPAYIPGDINKDGKIDDNDLTSYQNYTGLRRGDGDFDYVSIGDINRNGIIDAFDISHVATRLGGGIEEPWAVGDFAGTVNVKADHKTLNNGDLLNIEVTGKELQGLNALSMAIPYSAADYEVVGVVPSEALKGMVNLTNDRLHSNGDKVLYPTFVTLGSDPSVNGTTTLMTITLRAKRKGAPIPTAENITLVDKLLRTK